MIIWGSRSRDRQVATGGFYCPTCRAHSVYSHQRISRYFTLYFIPLFPTSTLGEYVRCLRCSGEFKTTLLEMSREQIEALLAPWRCGLCANFNPYSEIHCSGCGARKDYVPPDGSRPDPASGDGYRPPPVPEHPAGDGGYRPPAATEYPA